MKNIVTSEKKKTGSLSVREMECVYTSVSVKETAKLKKRQFFGYDK